MRCNRSLQVFEILAENACSRRVNRRLLVRRVKFWQKEKAPAIGRSPDIRFFAISGERSKRS
jgi:hypothetical protein